MAVFKIVIKIKAQDKSDLSKKAKALIEIADNFSGAELQKASKKMKSSAVKAMILANL